MTNHRWTLGALLTVAALAVPHAAAIELLILDVEPGGGDNDAQAKCDAFGNACAAAAAVALDGCVSANLNAAGSGEATVLWVFPAEADASVEGEITSCMSVATAQAVTGAATIEATMENSARAKQADSSIGPFLLTGGENKNSRTCLNTVLDDQICGPTGTTLSLTFRDCVSGEAHAAVNMQNVDALTGELNANLETPTVGVGTHSVSTVGHAEAKAKAVSASCDAAQILSSPASNDEIPDDLRPHVKAFVMDTVLERVNESLAPLEEEAGENAMAQEMVDVLREAMIQELSAAVDQAILPADA